MDDRVHYVYRHIDPITKELLYIGFGRAERAYQCYGNKNRAIQRSYEHSQYLQTLMNKGYVPHEWVQFHLTGLTEQQARQIEQYLIKKLNPRFNKKHGPSVMFSDDEVRKIISLKDSGLSDTKISKLMKCSQTTISRIFSGTRSGYKEISQY